MASNLLLGLDIGTSWVKVVLAENRGGRPALRLIFKQPSLGLRRGAIVDLREASQVVGRALFEVKKLYKSALKNIYVSIGSTQVKAQSSRGIVAVSRADNEIYQDDIDRAIRASQAVNLVANRTIIHNVTREFIIDGIGDVIDPLGLSGSRLEVVSLIIDAFSPHIKNLTRVIELSGGRLAGMFFGPIVASRAVLSKKQKDLGVALIDIGAGTTGLSVYEENKLIGVAKFPFGAGNVSNDLAIALKIPVSAAEDLKLDVGCAVAREISSKELVDLRKFSPEVKGTPQRRYIAEIIEIRLAEIFEFVNNELKTLGKAGQLAGGAVLVGGGAKMPGITDLAMQKLKLSSQIGSPLREEWVIESPKLSESFEDPEFAGALGLALGGSDEERWKPAVPSSGFKLRNLLRYFNP
ncbi:MAG: cell division protein FtsA [Candidatus Liptonbacteria bacterium]|nr:cell division protein FtsA [Candidatus Liptonbacteria bacterium]